ncbi:MAG: ATP-binding cassette domain-containing protein, partial [Planctomycetota bacterium]|nr:ATP-binding cassette domain-containing protein [Planctomycetota bacterium]
RVELKDVSFGYSKVDRPLLKNFNLVVEPGQRVALVGGSGSGKSTAAKLITGLYEPWSGEILFDDTPVKKIPRQVLANSVASVAQSIFLFAGTVRDNLTLWDETVQEDRLEEACRDAAIDEVVRNLPGGFNGELIEAGSNLSGGQRQRLEIARALIPRPSVLILDEATSALDTEIEQVIDRNLRRRGCSTILVSHRLSTVRDCDEIIVLKRGKIVQRGTHEELWKKQKGEYAQLLMSEGGDLPS